MEDPQLELADVKAQYLEAETKLTALAAEVRNAASARQTLGETGESVAAAADAVAATASDLQDVTERLRSAALAIEKAEPGEIRDRLDAVAAKVDEVDAAVALGMRVQSQVRVVAILTLVAVVIVAILLLAVG